MQTTVSQRSEPFEIAAVAAANEIAHLDELAEMRQRLERLPRYVQRCGDVLADLLEELVVALRPEHTRAAARVSSHLLDVLLAEEGFSRRFWKVLRRHLRLLQAADREEESETCLREVLALAAVFS